MNSCVNLSPEDVGNLIVKLGDAYKQYYTNFVSNSISGKVLLSLTEAECESYLLNIGVSSALHRRVLATHLRELKDSSKILVLQLPSFLLFL